MQAVAAQPLDVERVGTERAIAFATTGAQQLIAQFLAAACDAAALRSRAAHVAFACPGKLFTLLEAMSPVSELRHASDDKSGFDLSVPVGDLPRLLAAHDTPAPLAVSAAPDRVALWRERLAALGPPPYLGVTWRAGTKTDDEPEFAARGEDPLYKEIDIAALATAVRAWPGTVLVLQRLPQQGEVAAFAKALGPVLDDVFVIDFKANE